MKDIDLKHKVLDYLIAAARRYKSFPQSFTPRHIGDDIGAYAPRVGVVAKDVVKEMQLQGFDIRYEKIGNKRQFKLYGRIQSEK